MSGNTERPRTPGRWRQLLDGIASIAIIVAATAVVWKLAFPSPPVRARNPPADGPLPKAPVSLQGAPIRGDRGAKAALIEFAEFECRYCGAFATGTLPILEEKYIRDGRLLLAFRHLPLPTHQQASMAATAAECAGMEGKFWEMHDTLFRHPNELATANLVAAANTIKLDAQRFRDCLAGGNSAEKIQADVALAKANQVRSTPTFFLGLNLGDGTVTVARRLLGAQPPSAFVDAIEEVLKMAER